MPNDTLRADARALPETTNRRAVMGAVLAAGAAAVLPAVASAASPTPPEGQDAPCPTRFSCALPHCSSRRGSDKVTSNRVSLAID